jgi:hypothetical protein
MGNKKLARNNETAAVRQQITLTTMEKRRMIYIYIYNIKTRLHVWRRARILPP